MALQAITALAQITLQASASSITFSGIPNTYRDLILVFQGTTTPANGAGFVRFNSDSANNYNNVIMAGNTTPPYSGLRTGISAIDFAQDFAVEAGANNASVLQVLDYSATDKHKTVITRTNIGSSNVPAAMIGRWTSSAAINSVTFTLNQNAYAAGATFSIYGRIA